MHASMVQYQSIFITKDPCENIGDCLLQPLRIAFGSLVTVERQTPPHTFRKEVDFCPLVRTISAIFALVILPLTLMGFALTSLSDSRRDIQRAHKAYREALAASGDG